MGQERDYDLGSRVNTVMTGLDRTTKIRYAPNPDEIKPGPIIHYAITGPGEEKLRRGIPFSQLQKGTDYDRL